MEYKIVAARLPKEEKILTPKDKLKSDMSKYLLAGMLPATAFPKAYVKATNKKLGNPKDYIGAKFQVEDVQKNKTSSWASDLKYDKTYYYCIVSWIIYKVPFPPDSNMSLKDYIGKILTSMGGANPVDQFKNKEWWSYIFKSKTPEGKVFYVEVGLYSKQNIDDPISSIESPEDIQIKFTAHYSFRRRDFVTLVDGAVDVNKQFVRKMLNIAVRDNCKFTIPLLEVSLSSPANEKYKNVHDIFKLPNSDTIKLKFEDIRDKVKASVKLAIGISAIPDILPKYNKPPKGVIYDSYGTCPSYAEGAIPNAICELEPVDYYQYCYRMATPKEIENKEYTTHVARAVDNVTVFYYLVRVAPVESTCGEFVNKIVYTDFENEFVFYYNQDGQLKTKVIIGSQKLSKNDIMYLSSTAPINFYNARYPSGRNVEYAESKEYDELAIELDKVKQQIRPDNFFFDMAQVYKLNVMLLKEYGNYKRIMELYEGFLDKFGGATSRIANDAVGYCVLNIDNPSKGGYDIEKIKEEVKLSSQKHLAIAQDKQGNTPGLPKEINNFNPSVNLYPQQAIAIAMTDDQDITMLDVDMGGGKTCMMVADICNQLQKGKGKRPLIVCPGKTLAQNKKEIEDKWCAGTMNIFAINTETWNKITEGGEKPEALKDIINKMPPNTIYMTDYSFLSYDNIKLPIGEEEDKNGKITIQYIRVFPRAKLFINEYGFDMVYLDESHYIKNTASRMSRAVAVLGKAKIKRITSGTIIPNSPSDLFGQLRFLDPTILGRKDEFLRKFANKMDRMGKVLEWKEGAQKEIRELIQKRGGISERRSMWRWRMPKLIEHLHFVELTEIQQQIYTKIMNDVQAAIDADSKMKAALMQLENDNIDYEDTTETEQVLAKLSRFTTFLSAPGSDVLIKALQAVREGKSVKDIQDEFKKTVDKDENFDDDSNLDLEDEEERQTLSNEDIALLEEIAPKITEEDIRGPKIAKVEEILSTHFSKGLDRDGSPVNGKVIVFCQRNDVAKNTLAYIDKKWQAHAVWYNASREAELVRFQQDPSCWIIIAVDKSLKEGINLQVASRVIRMDIHWNPGDMDQSYARAYRNGQKREVNVDLILCDNTMEVCKYMRLISKEYINRKLISDFDETKMGNTTFQIVGMSISNMKDFNDSALLADYEFMHNLIQDQEIEESKMYQKKYATYEASGIGKVGSGKLIEGSRMVVTPELKAERKIMLDGKIAKRKSLMSYEDIGMDVKEVQTRIEKEQKEKIDKKTNILKAIDKNTGKTVEDQLAEQTTNENLHLYFLDRDDETFLMTPYNSTSRILAQRRFVVEDVLYVKVLKVISEVEELNKKLKKRGYTTNLGDIQKDMDLKRLLSKKRSAGALPRLMKYYQTTSAKNSITFWYSKMEGEIFLVTNDVQLEGFRKLSKIMCRKVDQSSVERVIKKVNAMSPIGNLPDLVTECKLRFKKQLNIKAILSYKPRGEEDSSVVPKTSIPKQKEKVVKKENVLKTKSVNKNETFSSKDYSAFAICFGCIKWARINKLKKQSYADYVSFTGDTFRERLLKKGCKTFNECVSYIKDDKKEKEFYRKFNLNRKPALAFLKEMKQYFGEYSEVMPYIKKYNSIV